MTLHVAYSMGTILNDIMKMTEESPETWLRELRHVDEEGETALSLLLKIEASDFFILTLLQMDKWALGVRCKKTGSFPVHVVYERHFTPELRRVVAEDSFWIMCSYNNDGNTVLHLALQCKCEDSIICLLDVMSNTALMLTAFVHENKLGKIPLELAIERRHECSSNDLVFKILETTLLSGYACEVIFVNNMDSIVVFDCAHAGISMFASFIRNSCDTSLHFHKIEYEHCGRMIELESREDCEKSVKRKKALVCYKYEDNLYRRITAIRKNDRVDYDYWMVDATLMEYMNAMKIMKKNRTRKQADMASQALIEGQTELAELMACSMIEAEDKDKLKKAEAALRKQKAKQANKQKRISKQFEQEQQIIADKKHANEVLAQKKHNDAQRGELARLAKEHEKNTKHKALLLQKRENEQEENQLFKQRKKEEEENQLFMQRKKEEEENHIFKQRKREQEDDILVKKPVETEPAADTANTNECCVCLEKTKNTVLVPCHHMCLCESCAVDLMKNTMPSCPLCRAKVQKTIKIFL